MSVITSTSFPSRDCQHVCGQVSFALVHLGDQGGFHGAAKEVFDEVKRGSLCWQSVPEVAHWLLMKGFKLCFCFRSVGDDHIHLSHLAALM